MNQENYCSLNVAQKLVDAGIVLETDAVWFHFKGWWQLLHRKGNDYIHIDLIPAPSFAEIWRELPFQSYIKKLDDGSTLVWICDDDADGKYIESNMIANSNPADALAELLIWAKGQEVV